MRRRADKSGVKSTCLTHAWLPILSALSLEEEDGISGVTVECVDIGKNTSGEGSLLVEY